MYTPIRADKFFKFAVKLGIGCHVIFKTHEDSTQHFALTKILTFDEDKTTRSIFLYTHQRKNYSEAMQIPVRDFDDVDSLLDALTQFLEKFNEKLDDEIIYVNLKFKRGG